jgi:hypothetical protein
MVGGREKEQEEENDSGYASDAIMQEEEEFEMSPRERKPMVWGPRQKRGTPVYRSPDRKSSWNPNLKRELGGDSSPFCHRDSTISTASSVSRFEDDIGRAPRSHWAEPASYRDSIVSAISEIGKVERSESPRKTSTLLHPSSPSIASLHLQHAIIGEIKRPYTPPSTTPPRTPSTLLHPSTPEPLLEQMSMMKTWELNQRAVSPPLTPPTISRPTLGHRKGSSLLHPSPPTSSNDTAKVAKPIIQLQLPMSRSQILTKAVASVIKVEECGFELSRRESVLHSCLSDVDSESDYGSDVDEEAEMDTQAFVQEVDYVTARAGMVSRASRISFHGPNMRVLQSM